MLSLFLRVSLVWACLPSCLSLRRQAAGLENVDVEGEGGVDFSQLEAKQAECDALLEANKDGFLSLPDAQRAQQLLAAIQTEYDAQNMEFQKSIYPVGSRCEVNYQGIWYPGTVQEFADGIFKVQADSDAEGMLTPAHLAHLKGRPIDESTVNDLFNHQDKISLAKDVFTKALHLQDSVEFSKSASGNNVTSNLMKLNDLIPGYSGEGHLRYASLTKEKGTLFGAKSWQYSFTIYTDRWDSKIWNHGRGPKQSGAEFDFGGHYALDGKGYKTVSMTSIPEFTSGGVTLRNLKIRMISRGAWGDSDFSFEWDLVKNAESCPLGMDIEAQTVTCDSGA